MKLRSLLVFSSLFALSLADSIYSYDPYLQFRPPFARSLPVQILLTGVVLTLVVVLFIHLLFTAQYHWPLAPVNYVLQLSGVTTLLISLIATIHVVLNASFAESEKWPYMLSYIAVNVPPLDNPDDSGSASTWTVAERATWLVMTASTSGLIQITHIQFLTLLYPSRLEGRLIFALLGPLAVVAAIVQLLPISGSISVLTIATSIRNVCNATLSLLFTLALFIWGLLVNRSNAWRTDGGTAVFGAAALSLAVISTALNFLYVHKEEEIVWLPILMWAVVLWQSFLGWWWWVGAGAAGGKWAFATEEERVEETLKREAKRERRRREKRERKEERKAKQKKVLKGVEAFATRTQSNSVSADATASGIAVITNGHEPRLRGGITPRRTATITSTATSITLADDSASAHNTSTEATPTSRLSYITTLPRLLPGMIHHWYGSLRHAHNAAARVQAVERVERMREAAMSGGVNINSVEGGLGEGLGQNGEGERQNVEVEVEGWGWGWEGFGWRRRWVRKVEAKSKNVDENLGNFKEKGLDLSRSPSRSRREDSSSSEEEDMYMSDADNSRRQRRRTEHECDSDSSPNPNLRPPPPTHPPPTQNQRRQQAQQQQQNTPRTATATPTAAAAARPRTLWWWGPLWRWRLQDSTVYR